MTYRIADEAAPGVIAEPGLKPPWHPLGIFTLLVFLPTFLPFGAALGALNWGRFGFPERRLIWFVMGLFAFALPFLLAQTPATPTLVATAALMARLGYAFSLLTTQRPLFDAYAERGGKSASSWPVWGAGAIALALGLIVARKMPMTPAQQNGPQRGNPASGTGAGPRLGLPR